MGKRGKEGSGGDSFREGAPPPESIQFPVISNGVIMRQGKVICRPYLYMNKRKEPVKI
jgi:hypothetical protein